VWMTTRKAPAGSRRPKNRGPFHAVPVIARAMVERLEYFVATQAAE
jgi:hypothetical protein